MNLPFSVLKIGLHKFNKQTYKLTMKPSAERLKFLADYNLLPNFDLPKLPKIAA